MSDTPKTDALIDRLGFATIGIFGHARDLERENAALKAALAEALTEWEGWEEATTQGPEPSEEGRRARNRIAELRGLT